MDLPQFLYDGEKADRAAIEAMLGDIQWNCEHCTARLTFERNAETAHENGVPEGTSPCKGCRLQKYGYGGQA